MKVIMDRIKVGKEPLYLTGFEGRVKDRSAPTKFFLECEGEILFTQISDQASETVKASLPVTHKVIGGEIILSAKLNPKKNQRPHSGKITGYRL